MAFSGLFVLSIAGALVILAILGLIAMFSRGQILPAIVGIVLLGFLILGVGGAVVYMSRSSTVIVGPTATERNEATRQELLRIAKELHAQQSQLPETDSPPSASSTKSADDGGLGEDKTEPADKPTEPTPGEP